MKNSLFKKDFHNLKLKFNLFMLGGSVEQGALNKKALDIVQRVRDKLTGRDFDKKVIFIIVNRFFVMQFIV